MRIRIEEKTFIEFLCEARLKSYAGGKKPVRDENLSKSYTFYDRKKFPKLTYKDSYVGDENFAGQEIISYGSKPIWSMTYFGNLPYSMTKAYKKEILKFLRAALRTGPQDNQIPPVRGPKGFYQGTKMYRNKCYGGIGHFNGEEEIVVIDPDVAELGLQSVYSCFYQGGLLDLNYMY